MDNAFDAIIGADKWRGPDVIGIGMAQDEELDFGIEGNQAGNLVCGVISISGVVDDVFAIGQFEDAGESRADIDDAHEEGIGFVLKGVEVGRKTQQHAECRAGSHRGWCLSNLILKRPGRKARTNWEELTRQILLP